MAKSTWVIVRMDSHLKQTLTQAAQLRNISISDYVKLVVEPQATQEVASAAAGVISLTPDEQLSFWNALQTPPSLTPAQQELGSLMRGDA